MTKCLKDLPYLKKKKNFVYKNQGQEPIHQKYKANESMNTQPTKKMKTNNQQKIRKRKKPYANKTQGYKMTINDNKKDQK
jgi:hypothetical protein